MVAIFKTQRAVSNKKRLVLAKAIMLLFKNWDISYEEQCELLGICISNSKKLKSMENGLSAIPEDRETSERVGYLLSIHKTLRLIYPKNPELISGWVTMRNQNFDGRTPLEVMIEDGNLGVIKVNRYLDMSLQY